MLLKNNKNKRYHNKKLIGTWYTIDIIYLNKYARLFNLAKITYYTHFIDD